MQEEEATRNRFRGLKGAENKFIRAALFFDPEMSVSRPRDWSILFSAAACLFFDFQLFFSPAMRPRKRAQSFFQPFFCLFSDHLWPVKDCFVCKTLHLAFCLDFLICRMCLFWNFFLLLLVCRVLFFVCSCLRSTENVVTLFFPLCFTSLDERVHFLVSTLFIQFFALSNGS